MASHKKYLIGEIYDKSWSGNYWGANGALNKAKELYWLRVKRKKKHSALASLSSTYFSAAGNAKANFFKARFYSKPIWIFRIIVCFFQANRLSDKLERISSITNMTSEEIDVRIAILLASLRYKRARRCVTEVFSRKKIKGDTEALVLSHFLNCWFIPLHESIRYCGDLRAILRRPLRSTTRVRVLRELGLFQKRRGDVKGAREFFSEAIKIAKDEGFNDQILKIQSAMR